jgi:hypothetical protein
VRVGESNYIKATCVVYDIGTEKSLSFSAFARESENKKGMDDSQMTGTASSYARKYALSATFLIDDNEDVDSMDNRKQEEKTKTEKK